MELVWEIRNLARQGFEEASNFAKEWWEAPHTVGTPFACSRATALEMTRYITKGDGRRILDVGTGDGVTIDAMLPNLGKNDKVVIVECGKGFCARLREKYKNDNRIEIYEGKIQDYAKFVLQGSGDQIEAKLFDHVVGAVPMHSLPTAKAVDEVFKAHIDLIKRTKGGTYTQVGYAGMATLKTCLTLWERKIAQEIVATKEALYRTHNAYSVVVWKNLPPARVHHMKFTVRDLEESKKDR